MGGAGVCVYVGGANTMLYLLCTITIAEKKKTCPEINFNTLSLMYQHITHVECDSN